MTRIFKLLIPIPLAAFSALATAQTSSKAGRLNSLDVEWYQSEVEASPQSGLLTIIISGRTRPSATVTIDGKNITLIKGNSELEVKSNCRLMNQPSSKSSPIGSLRKGTQVEVLDSNDNWFKVRSEQTEGFASKLCFESGKVSLNFGSTQQSSPQTKANSEGYFELALDQPPGLVQIPILVSASGESSKTYLITFDISSEKVRMNTKVSKNKPPAASKHLRLWLGVGSTYQSYSQTVSGKDVEFVNLDSPSLLARLGYWGNNWGFDGFLRDAPGKIDAAVQPFTIKSGRYHWMTAEARGMYQFNRDSTSRLLGMQSQWQLFFGLQHHFTPFLDIDALNVVTVRKHNLTMATLGAGLLLNQEKTWSFEFSTEYQIPVGASAEPPNSFTVSSAVAFDARLGATYKLATNWRLGGFMYVQSHSYNFTYKSKALATEYTGKQNLFYSTFDLHLGYEY